MHPMKAALCTKYGPPEVLVIGERPKPEPKRNEVLVRIHAAVISAGDCRIRAFDSPFLWYRPFMALMVGFSRPRNPVLGMGMSGIIEAVGPDVTKFKTGDSVVGGTWTNMQFGCYAEYIAIYESGVIAHTPPGLTHAEAVAVLGGISSVNFLNMGRIAQANKVLIYGASGALGTTAVQIAKYYGAHVTGVCSGANIALVRSLGADSVIDYTKEDITQCGGRYDLIFDTVGKISDMKVKSISAPGGRFISAITSGHAASTSNGLLFLNKLVAEKKIRPVIDRTYTLDDIVEAHRYVDSGRKKGAVILTITS